MSKARTLANLISDNAELADGQISVAEVVGAAPLASPTFTGTVTTDAVTMNGYLTVNGGGVDVNTVIYPNGIAMEDSRAISFGTGADFELSSGGTFLDHNLKDNARHLRIINGLTEHHRFSGDGSVIFNNSGADADFQVKSDSNSHMLFVDAGNNSVKINSNSTTYDGGAPFQIGYSDTNVYHPHIQTDNRTYVHYTGYGGGSAHNTFIHGYQVDNPSSGGYLRVAQGLSNNVVSGVIQSQDGLQYVWNSGKATGDADFTPTTMHEIDFGTGGNVIFNKAGADLDFLVESVNYPHMFYVNADTDTVTIGGSDVGTHAGMFNVAGNLGVITGSGNPTITIKTGGTGNNPGINYRAGDNIIFDNTLIASAATDYWRVGFGTSGSVTSEVLTVNTNSRVGIQTTEPDAELHIAGSHPHIDLGPKDANRAKLGFRYDNLYLGATAGGGEIILKNNVGSTDEPSASGDEIARFGDDVVINNNARDQDFKVKSDNEANMFFLEAANDRIFIAGAASSYDANRLNIRGPSVVPGSTNGNVGIYSTDNMTSGVGGSLAFGGRYTTNGTYYMFGGIQAVKTNATSGQSNGTLKLYYVNNSNGTVPYHTANQESIEFNPDGNNVDFRVESDSNANMFMIDAEMNKAAFGTTPQTALGGLVHTGSLSVGSANHVGYSVYSNHEGNIPSNTTVNIMDFEGPAFARYMKVTISGYQCRREVYFAGYQSWDNQTGGAVGDTTVGTQIFANGANSTSSRCSIYLEVIATSGTSGHPKYRLKLGTGSLTGQLYDTTSVVEFFNTPQYVTYQ